MKRKGILLASLCLSAMAMTFLVGIQTNKQQETGFECPNQIKDPDYVPVLHTPAYIPLDEYYSSHQYISFNHIGGIEKVWDAVKGNGVRVAVVDTAFDYDHPDFIREDNSSIFSISEGKWFLHVTGNSTDGYSTAGYTGTVRQFVHGSSFKLDGNTIDGSDVLRPHNATSGVAYNHHGTNVSSVIASANHQTNKTGAVGVAPNVTIIPYKNDMYSDTLMYIMNDIYFKNTDDDPDNDIDVVNMSIESTGSDSNFQAAIKRLTDLNVIVVAAAGNHQTSTSYYPASYPGVIGVGALDRNSSTSSASSYTNFNKPDATSSDNNNVDLVAPGTVYTATYTGTNTGHGYHETFGTSFASPIVASAAALWKEVNPTETLSSFKNALFNSCDDIGLSNWDTTFGYGRLNISRLLNIAENKPYRISINNPEIQNDELTLERGDTFDIDWNVLGTGTFSDAVNFYTLSGEDTVLSVDSNGHVVTNSAGTEYLVVESVQDPSVYSSIYITVTEPPVSVTGVSLNKNSAILTIGDTDTLVATVEPNNATDKSITWTTGDSSIATVNNGVITAVSTGTTTITVTTNDGSFSATCTVKVIPPHEVTDSTKYTLITSVDDLAIGQSYLITNGTTGTIKTMSASSNNNNRPTVSTTVSSGKITRGSSVLSVTLGGSSGAYTFKTDNYGGTTGYLNATSTTTDNYLKVVSSLDKYAYFSIGFSNNQAIITCTGKSSRNIIKCNSSGTPISCYSSGQNAVYLWKEVQELTSIEVATSPKTNYNAGECFDPSGLVIIRNYSNGLSDTYAYENHTSEFSFSPSLLTPLTLNNESVSITYGGFSTNVPINVEKAPVTGITATVSKNYYVGQTIVKDDISVQDNNGESITDFEFTPYKFTYQDAQSGGALTDKEFDISYSSFSTKLTAKVQRKAYESTVGDQDTLTRVTTGVASGSTSYSNWSNKTVTSSAVYAGNSAGGNNAIQLRSSSNSGIISTSSGGNIKKVTVVWQGNTSDDRVLDVYGKNTAYSATSDLYNSSNQGVLLGSIIKGTSTELEISGEYSYVGVRSRSNSMYLTSITFSYGGSETPENIANFIMFADTEGQCEDVGQTKGKFTLASGYFENLSKEDRATFMTSDNYVISTARTRFIDWAKHHNKTIIYSGDDYIITPAVQHTLLSAVVENKPSTIVIIATLIGLTSLGGYIFIRRRKEN